MNDTPFQTLLGEDPAFQSAIRSAHLLSATDVTVLITGESGSGKELFAHAIHASSPRAGEPFITINCAALPDSLAESELFGHARGSFTGAVADREGRIQAAHGGTLFLDEVGELTPVVQAKLLRFLETGEVQPVGVNRPVTANVRVVAATHRDLFQRVREGQFREDLYYRLNVVPVTVPPLRERSRDVEMLLEHFLKSLADKHQVAVPRLDAACRSTLLNHSWPGNVRELRNLCERLVILHPAEIVRSEHLPEELFSTSVEEDLSEIQGHGGFVLPESGIDFSAMESHMIKQALRKARGNRSRAARLLGLTRDAFLYRIKKHAISF
ncbi:MAG: sigma 54-interacting transcriptional regulator [Magnetococcales bacterium]|nr:sigma 54-interacting transcriptional regulator [Magnetococcales bacterium]